MNQDNQRSTPSLDRDPFQILGLAPDASSETIRTRYLELIKRHRPENDPDKFQQIQTAYKLASDPLAHADHLLSQYLEPPCRWDEFLQQQRNDPPVLPTRILLAIGNQS